MFCLCKVHSDTVITMVICSRGGKRLELLMLEHKQLQPSCHPSWEALAAGNCSGPSSQEHVVSGQLLGQIWAREQSGAC